MKISIAHQLLYLFILALPVACIAWTVTHEEVFREPREYFTQRSKDSNSIFARKFFYLFTCEYCFSHYVVLFILILTRYQLLFTGFTGYLISFFSLVWIANIYMSLYGFIRLGLKKERAEAKVIEDELEEA